MKKKKFLDTSKIAMPTDDEKELRQEQITTLRYDNGYSVRDIVKATGLDFDQVRLCLKNANKEFAKEIDPEARNEFLNIQVRHHKFVIHRLFREVGTTNKGTKERDLALDTLSKALNRYEKFMFSVGLIAETPKELIANMNVKQDTVFEASAELMEMVDKVFGRDKHDNHGVTLDSSDFAGIK